MKSKIRTALLLSIAITGCQQQSEEAIVSEPAVDPGVKAQFEESDAKIEQFLNQLDNPDTTQKVGKQILCTNYPSIPKELHTCTIKAFA